jgi:hypothetical protein
MNRSLSAMNVFSPATASMEPKGICARSVQGFYKPCEQHHQLQDYNAATKRRRCFHAFNRVFDNCFNFMVGNFHIFTKRVNCPSGRS